MSWRDYAVTVGDAAQAVFGEAVTYTPAGASPVTIDEAIFTEAHEVGNFVDADIELVDTTSPTLDVQVADLPAELDPEDRWRVVVDPVGAPAGKLYAVDDVQRDGGGMAKLFLHEVAV